MASIIKRKSKYSVAYYYVNERGEKKQKWETCQHYGEAQRRKAEIELQQKEGTFVPPSEITVRDLLKEFVRIYGREEWALSTFESNCALIANYINPIIGDKQIQQIGPKFIDEYYQELKRTKSVVSNNRKPKNEFVSPAVISSIHKLLRCAFNQAVKWEMIKTNPFPSANKPKTKYKKRDMWTAEYIWTALNACTDMKLYLAINLAFACSLRIGEISGLTWDKIFITDAHIARDDAYLLVDQELARVSRQAREQLDDKDIIFIFPSLMPNTTTNLVLKKPKTESSIRKVWIPKTLAYILREWKTTQDEFKDFLGQDYYDYNLVLTFPNGRPVEHRILEKDFGNLRKEAGLPDVVFHSLRHSSTTYKLKLNHGDLKATQGDTGHSQINMITDVYAHILDEDRKINAQKFETAFYAKHDLRKVAPPEDENTELAGLVAQLQQSPELVQMLSALLSKQAISK